MKHIWLVGAALCACVTSAEAASLPPPAKLCAMIAATADEGNQKPAVWQKTSGGYFCRTDGMSAPAGGVVFMNTYQATGTKKNRAANLLFHIVMYDSMLRKDTISQLFLPRITAVFAAANAGPVPDALAQAINTVTPATVATTLGTARTQFVPSNNPASPYNSAQFEFTLTGAAK
jgi:hypothetical protein